MDNLAPRHRLLHRPLGPSPLRLFDPQQTSFLDPAHLRHQPRLPALVPNALGYIRHGHLGPVGGITPCRRARGPLPVALAWGAGRHPRGWVWHDSVADSDTIPRRICARVRTGARECGDYRWQSHESGWQWTRQRFPQSGADDKRAQEASFLGWTCSPAGRLCRVREVVQAGAVDEAVSAEYNMTELLRLG